ncbi:MAG: hypothetical protein U5J95_02530 [Balneolaceae bacterium]|nr:hypothetical protein [Balneolaceae bacterium]
MEHSLSLAVKDISSSKAFHKKLGFKALKEFGSMKKKGPCHFCISNGSIYLISVMNNEELIFPLIYLPSAKRPRGDG